ncbi:MAG TPA: hypothetical protein VFZ01_18280, partial [Geminicoccaceae bacterium]
GRGNSQLQLSGEGLKLRVGSVVIAALEIRVLEPEAGIALVADDITLRDLDVRGLTAPEAPPLISVDAIDRLSIEGCDLDVLADDTFKVVGEAVEVIGVAREEAGLEPQALLFEEREVRRRLAERARQLTAVPQAQRTQMFIDLNRFANQREDITAIERVAIGRLADVIRADRPSDRRIVKGLDGLRLSATRSRPHRALVIASALPDTTLHECRISGIVRLYGGQDEVPLNQDEARRLVEAFRPDVRSEDTRLVVSSCDLAQLDVDGRLVAQMRAVLQGSPNRLLEDVFRFVEIRGSRFRAAPNRTALTMVAERITVTTSNLDPTPQAESGFVGSVVGLMSAYTGNFGGHNGARIMDITVFVMEEAANVALSIQS